MINVLAIWTGLNLLLGSEDHTEGRNNSHFGRVYNFSFFAEAKRCGLAANVLWRGAELLSSRAKGIKEHLGD